MVWWANVYITIDQNIPVVLILVLVDDGMVGHFLLFTGL